MKDCLLIANSNAATCKEVFPLIKNNQLRWGYNWVKTFIDTEGNEKLFGNICWFVTLPTTNKKKPILTQSYDPEKYPHYDNYDAIDCGKVAEIPMDYNGVIGVPITFLDKYCPEQFEIVDLINRYMIFDYFGVNEDVRKRHSHCANINGKAAYSRILIRKRT